MANITRREPYHGRPTLLTEEMAETILTRLIDGESLRRICSSEGMPTRAAVLKWVRTDPIFREQYRLARELQAETLADEMIDISDDGSNDWMPKVAQDGQNQGWLENGEALRRSQLRIDTRKWMAARMWPRRWGNNGTMAVTDAEGGPVVPKTIDPRQLTPEARAALKTALTIALRTQPQDVTYEQASEEDENSADD